jgi:hypothetical protein
MLEGVGEKSSAYLDEALTNETLAEWLPLLQTAVPIDAADVAPLKASLEQGKAPIDVYRNLKLGRATQPIPGADLAEVLRMIAKRPGGVDVAVDVLSMRFHGDRDIKREHDPDLVQVGRELLLATVLTTRTTGATTNSGASPGHAWAETTVPPRHASSAHA